MTRRWLCLLFFLSACGGPADHSAASGGAPDSPDNAPPVALNADNPVTYPPDLYTRGVEGEVTLQLYVDSAGTVVPDSTRVAQSSGYPAFDSAAVADAPRLRFSPAMQNGKPVAATFLQPIRFHHPQRGGDTP
jgi:protein TonB